MSRHIPPFVHQFSTHPLKRRITMLRQRSTSFRTSLIVCTGLSLVLAAGLTGMQGCKQEPVKPVQLPASAVPAPESNPQTVTLSEAFTQVEQMPEFRGDVATWLAEHIRYPEEARKGGKQGRVVVKFVVDRTGAVKEPQIIKSVDPALDAEALRAVQEMPAWIPGREGGKAVSVYYNLPISFRLQ